MTDNATVRRYWWLGGVLFVLWIGFFCFVLWYQKKTDANVHIVICDVGQGDAILIYQGFYQILIDSSRGSQVLSCLRQFMPFWDTTIDLLIITHFDADHTGGLTHIAKSYQVTHVLAGSQPKDRSRGDGQESPQNATELPFMSQVEVPFFGQSMSFSSGMRLHFFAPTAGAAFLSSLDTRYALSKLADNDTSLVTLLEYGPVRFLAVGDLEKTGESVLTSLLEFGSIDILKLGHHGAKTSSSLQFLEAITPQLAVISSGLGNSYGHPAPEVLTRLGQLGTRWLRTDGMGTIELVSDGQLWWLAQ